MVPDYAFQVVNKSDGHPVRLGKKSIRFELRSGDCHQKKPTSYNDCKADPPAERHELGQEYDKIALSGVKFDRFYVSPVCSPTRAEILTGRHHVRTGVYDVSLGGERINSDEQTIAGITLSLLMS